MLAEKGTDLGLVDDTTLGTGLDHRRDEILREAFDETHRDTVLENLGGRLTHCRLHHVIELNLELFLVTLALTDFLFDSNSDRVVKCHALLLTVEGVFRHSHIGVLLDLGVEACLRLVDDTVRVVELLDVITGDLGKLSS